MSEVSIATSLSSTTTLNDGVDMPMFGFGTSKLPWDLQTDGIADVVAHAITSGHRLVDTAQRYETEGAVGEGFRMSGVPREEVFIVSKVWLSNMGTDKCIQSVKESLKRLGVDYVDLFLVHAPCTKGRSVETYIALLNLKHQGLIRSVGVSNFNVSHLKGLKAAGCPLPSVNQIELNPFFRQQEIVNYCRENNITVMGYSPLAKARGFRDKTLKTIANKYDKSVPQVMIRWSVQKGYITIPKTCKMERIEENADVFDFQLDQQEMVLLDCLPEEPCAWTPQLNEEWYG